MIPVQHDKDAGKIERSCNCFYQKFIKFPEVGIFHSYEEFLHAALLESDSTVSSFVPQPLKFWIGNKPYIPDCYYVKKGKYYVVELKPGGKFSKEKEIPLTKYLERENIEFKVISNEDVRAKEQLALNWLEMIRAIVCNDHIDTQNHEYKLIDRFHELPNQRFGEVISKNNRFGDQAYEIALYKLCHKGTLIPDLDDKPISYDTEVILCQK